MSLQRQTIHSIKWSFLTSIANNCVLPIVFIVNRKLLTPEDFAIVVVATIFISFSQIIWGAGLAKTLIQRQDKIAESSDVVFWVNTFLGVVLFVLLYFLAPLIADSFQDQRIVKVLHILGVNIIFTSLTSVHLALFQKEMEFKKLFWIKIFTVALPGLFSIPLAYYYHSYWALVIGNIAGQLSQSILLYFMSTWKPRLLFDFALFKELWKFSGWVLISTLSAWFYLWADSLIVGIYYSSEPKELGIYQSGNQFATMVFSLFFTPMVPVLYSAMSKISNDQEKLFSKHKLIVKIFAMISLPIGFGLFVLQEHIEMVVFNVNWGGIAFVIGMLGLAQAISWVIVPNVEVYRAIGKPEIETKVVAGTLILYLFAYLIAIPYGMTAFVWTRLGMTCFGVLIHFYFAYKILKFPVKSWFTLTFSALICSVIMYFIVFLARGQMEAGLISLISLIGIGAISYTIMIFVLEYKFIKTEIFSLLKNR
jgi:O-antigen/teichoic acid export membrane protein